MTLNLDGAKDSGNWIKKTWKLPPYKSKKFMDMLDERGIELAQFKRSPIYKWAVATGLIKGDKWAG